LGQEPSGFIVRHGGSLPKFGSAERCPRSLERGATNRQPKVSLEMAQTVEKLRSERESKSMGVTRRFVDKDPAGRQIAFLAIGAYSGCFFSVALVLIAMASQKRVVLGLIIAALILVIDLPLSYWIVQSARKKQASRQSDSTGTSGTFSRRQ
jgi:Flp pilus assembly protein TadB